jgi:hypothetical protein
VAADRRSRHPGLRTGQPRHIHHRRDHVRREGTAKGADEWADIDPIWADDGSGLDLRVNIGDLIDAGLALCD